MMKTPPRPNGEGICTVNSAFPQDSRATVDCSSKLVFGVVVDSAGLVSSATDCRPSPAGGSSAVVFAVVGTPPSSSLLVLASLISGLFSINNFRFHSGRRRLNLR
jgi:hypothetical protein